MDIKSTLILICFYLSAVHCATIYKHELIDENVKFIETDSSLNSYIITATETSDRFYALNSENQITFYGNFTNVVSLKFNSKNELHIFDSVENDIFFEQYITIWLFDQTSRTISNRLNFTAGIDGHIAFFDDEDNLFFDSVVDGIQILRNNETTPVKILNVESYNIKNELAHAVDQDGNVILGVRYQSPAYDMVAIITKEEKNKPHPEPYFVNLNSKGEILEIATFSDGIFFGFTNSLVMLKNDYATDIRTENKGLFHSLHATDEKLFFRYEGAYCFLSCVTLDLEATDFRFFDDCSYIRQTFDGEGNAFFGLSVPESVVYSVRHNETSIRTLNLPNTLYIYGLEASDEGDVWVLAQNLYLIPSGSDDAVKVPGLPFVGEARPIKSKPGTGQVLVGLEDGLYIASK